MQTYTIHLNLTVYSCLSKTAIWSWSWLSILRQIIIFKMSSKEILKCLSTCEEIEKRLIVGIWCTMQKVDSRGFAELWWILSTQRHSWSLTEGAEWDVHVTLHLSGSHQLRVFSDLIGPCMSCVLVTLNIMATFKETANWFPTILYNIIIMYKAIMVVYQLALKLTKTIIVKCIHDIVPFTQTLHVYHYRYTCRPQAAVTMPNCHLSKAACGT